MMNKKTIRCGMVSPGNHYKDGSPASAAAEASIGLPTLVEIPTGETWTFIDTSWDRRAGHSYVVGPAIYRLTKGGNEHSLAEYTLD